MKKPKQKGAKAESVEKVTVDQLFKTLEATPFSIDDQPYASLFKIYHREFLNVSVEKKLIDPSSLSIAGDGTLVVTSARERKKKVTSLYFHCSILFSNMIPMGSLNASSDLKVFYPIIMFVNGYWILPMMRCLITCIAAGMGYSHLSI